MKMELGIEVKLFSEWKLCLGWYNIAIRQYWLQANVFKW